jgi:hypothetical protein
LKDISLKNAEDVQAVMVSESCEDPAQWGWKAVPIIKQMEGGSNY